jgi:hypothetical protein
LNIAGIQKNIDAEIKQNTIASITLESLVLHMFFLYPLTLKLMQIKPAPRPPPIAPRIIAAGTKPPTSTY